MNAVRTPPPLTVYVYPKPEPVIYEAQCMRQSVKDGYVHHELGTITFAISTDGGIYSPGPPVASLRIHANHIDDCLNCKLAGHKECRCSWLVGDAIVKHNTIDWLMTYAGLVVDGRRATLDAMARSPVTRMADKRRYLQAEPQQ